jgi:hypothetical protein
VLLNVLIAVLSDTHEKVYDTKEARGLKQKARMLLDLQTQMQEKDLQCAEWFPKWLHVLERREEGGDDDAVDGEHYRYKRRMESKVNAVEEKVGCVEKNVLEAMEGKIRAVEEKVGSAEKRVLEAVEGKIRAVEKKVSAIETKVLDGVQATVESAVTRLVEELKVQSSPKPYEKDATTTNSNELQAAKRLQ